MDILGYIFIGLAAIGLFVGLAKGFVKTLLDFLGIVGSLAVAILLNPTISNLQFVQDLLPEAPLVIGEMQIYVVRTVVVAIALWVVSFAIFLLLKGVFKWIFDRIKLLKFVDKLLGLVLGVGIVWIVFGALVGIANVGTDWLVAIDEQLAQTGISLTSIAGGFFDQINASAILNTVYSTFNPIGDLIANFIGA